MTNRIDTTFIFESFDNHFNLPHNTRIVFSGKYGSGKTTFLKSYFDSKKDEFNSFLLSPVKYSVGSNEDIIEYIKFDIIAYILNHFYEHDDSINEKEEILLWAYLNNDYKDLIGQLIKSISFTDLSDYDEPTKVIIKSYLLLLEKYKKFKNSYNQNSNTDSKILTEYLINSISRKGSIFEDDIITRTIRVYLEKIKFDTKKENVLIIDDLDRIDPEHIFRILNILSMHNDYLNNTYSNKFGFDRIIIVCDIDSIERYYCHKYGTNSNFSGYIEKFCSNHFYRLSNLDAIRQYCYNLSSFEDLSHESIKVLSLVLIELINKNIITIRNLIKFDRKLNLEKVMDSFNYIFEFSWEKYCKNGTFSNTNRINYDIEIFSSIKVLYILNNILGDNHKLIKIFKELSEHEATDNFSTEDSDSIIKTLGYLLLYIKNKENLENMFFSRSAHNDNCGKIHTNGPRLTFGNHHYFLKLKWGKNNKYNGEFDYFDSSYFVPEIKNLQLSKCDFFCEIYSITNFINEKFNFS